MSFMNLTMAIMLTTILFSKDSTATKKYKYRDYTKKIEVPGLFSQDPEKYTLENALLPIEIEKIKEKAKNYVVNPVKNGEIVTMKTSRGVMKIKLFPEVAPNHCNNFKKLANSGFYDKTYFHRVIPGFMIQGGDILTRDHSRKNDGTGSPGWTVNAEFNSILHKRGTLSMARSSDPNSAGSQFFICVADAPHLDGKYTAFGEVVENIFVADYIVNAETDYSKTISMMIDEIPKGQDEKQYIKMKNPKNRRFMYIKIPENQNAESFKYYIKDKLRSNNPVSKIELIEVKVD
mgnify:CR=1 FL=1